MKNLKFNTIFKQSNNSKLWKEVMDEELLPLTSMTFGNLWLAVFSPLWGLSATFFLVKLLQPSRSGCCFIFIYFFRKRKKKTRKSTEGSTSAKEHSSIDFSLNEQIQYVQLYGFIYVNLSLFSLFCASLSFCRSGEKDQLFRVSAVHYEWRYKSLSSTLS